MSEESDASRTAFATFCPDIRPVREVRTVGRMLAPEGFLQFVLQVSVTGTQIGEIPLIELSQQAPCPGALHAVPETSE